MTTRNSAYFSSASFENELRAAIENCDPGHFYDLLQEKEDTLKNEAERVKAFRKKE